MGFPADSTDYSFSFADLNQDGKLDGIGLFFPEQCDGGDGARWSQSDVLLLSSPQGYQIIDSLRLDHFAMTDFDTNGFYNVDSIGLNRIYATYLELHQGSTTCCPDVSRPVVFDYAKRALIR